MGSLAVWWAEWGSKTRSEAVEGKQRETKRKAGLCKGLVGATVDFRTKPLSAHYLASVMRSSFLVASVKATHRSL